MAIELSKRCNVSVEYIGGIMSYTDIDNPRFSYPWPLIVDNIVITSPPQSVVADEYSTATFSVQADGANRYQWYSGLSQVGTNSPSYSVVATSLNRGSNIYCIASNSNNSIQSASAYLGVKSYLYTMNGTTQYYQLSNEVIIPADFELSFDYKGSAADFSPMLGRDDGTRLARIDTGGVLRVYTGTANLLSTVKINDNVRHKIKITRVGQVVSIYIDDALDVTSNMLINTGICYLSRIGNRLSTFLSGDVRNLSIKGASIGDIFLPLTIKSSGALQPTYPSSTITASSVDYSFVNWYDDPASSPPIPADLSAMFTPITSWTGDAVSEGSRIVDNDGYLRTTGTLTKSSLALSEPLDGTIAILCDHGQIVENACNLGELSITQSGSPWYKILGFDYGGSWGDYILGDVWRYASTTDIEATGINLNNDVGFIFKNSWRSPHTSYSGIKPLVSNAQGVPTIVLTFDDGGDGQYNYRDALRDNDLGSTIFVPWTNVGNSSKLTVSMLQQMKTEGFDIQLNGTGDDSDMTLKPSVASAVSHLLDGKQWLVDNNLNDNAEFFCYPFGTFRVRGTDVTKSDITGVLGGNTVSMGSTTGITVGMLAVSKVFPYGTRVVSVNSSTQVTLSNNTMVNDVAGYPISSMSQYMYFVDDSGEFYTNKLQVALANAGFKIGRTTTQGYHHSRFGIGDNIGLTLFAKTSTITGTDRSDAVLLARVQEWVDYVKKYGVTCVSYWHNIIEGTTNGLNMSTTGFYAAMELLAAEQRAGNIQVLSMKQWYDRDCRNPINPYL